MSDDNAPDKPTPNSEKFKPQNVAGEGGGNPGGKGRAERNMHDVPRGSEPDQRGSSGPRGG